MLKTSMACVFLGAMLFSTAARADGVITQVGRCQTIFVVSAPEGYAVIEWASGPVPGKGDALVGNLGVTGQKNLGLANGAAVGVLIETYGMNEAAATQMLKNQCGLHTTLFGIRPPAR
jgi:hypothetical protein